MVTFTLKIVTGNLILPPVVINLCRKSQKKPLFFVVISFDGSISLPKVTNGNKTLPEVINAH
jgi:hypothetical protein